MTCKGVCDRYKAKKISGIGRYASGQKRCQICEIFIEWSGRWCPCCKYRLRSKPRNIVYKQKLAKLELKAGSEVKIYKKWKVGYQVQTRYLYRWGRSQNIPKNHFVKP